MITKAETDGLGREVSPLVQALMGAWAERAGVRALLIKGEIANLLGLRAPRGSIDADLWVSPDAFESFRAFLDDRGWSHHEVVDPTIDFGERLSAPHSQTHRHPAWPAEVDVHNRFPGLTAPPQEVFEAFWVRRQRHLIAHQEVWGPDRVGAALIQALHHLRTPTSQRHGAELDVLVAAVSDWEPSALVELGALADAVGAARTAADFLSRVGAPSSEFADRTDESEFATWQLATSVTDLTGFHAVYSIRKAPWKSRPGVLWRHFWFTPELLRVRDPAVFESGVRFPVFRARVRRWRSAARDLPRVLRASRRQP